MNKQRRLPAVISALVSLPLLSGIAFGETIQLPYQSGDGQGNQWVVYYQGQLQQQGNQPIFSQAGMITVNGQQARQQNQQAELDDKTKEVILNMQLPGTGKQFRRFKFDEETGIVRIIDVFDNNSNKEISLNLTYTTNTNFGVQSAEKIVDEKNKKADIAWSGMTGAGRAAMSQYAGKRAKVVPDLRYNQQNNSNQVQAIFKLKVPAKGVVALVSWHGSFDSAEAANQWVQQSRESKLLADLPADIKKAIVNVNIGGGSIGNVELLRGEMNDVVELRGGDQIRGDLSVETYKLATAFGEIELPAKSIAGIVSVGEFRTRQLLITTEGEIFGGELQDKTIALQLPGGQKTQIPLAQISRVGYRTGGADAPEWTFDKPMVFLRSGERCVIDPPTTPIDFVTRYGELQFKPDQVAAVLLKTDGDVHEVYLTDGSKLVGLLVEPKWPLKLVSATGDATVPFPLAAIARVQLKQLPDDVGAGKPTLTLQGGDIIGTRLSTELELQTTFDTLKLDAGQIKSLSKPTEGLPDVQVTMFDGSTFRGTLSTPSLRTKLLSSIDLEVPVASLVEYYNPAPYPAASVVAKVKEAVTQLNDDDWKKREAAEVTLVSLGDSIAGVLESSVDGQPPEVKQRLEAVIKKLRKGAPTADSKLTPPPPLD